MNRKPYRHVSTARTGQMSLRQTRFQCNQPGFQNCIFNNARYGDVVYRSLIPSRYIPVNAAFNPFGLARMPYRDSRPTPRKPPEPEQPGSRNYLHADEKPDSDPQFPFTPKKPGHISGVHDYKELLFKNLIKLTKVIALMGVTLFLAMKITTTFWSRSLPTVEPIIAPVTDSEVPAEAETFAPEESGTSTRPVIDTKTIRIASSHVDDGRELQNQGQVRAAIRSYQQGIRLWSEVPEALYLMGTAYLDLGEFENAERSLRKALLLSPDNAVILDQVGLALLQQGKTEDAYGFFRKALDVDASLGSAQLNLSLALIARGQRSEAHILLERYLEKHPTNVTALHRLALLSATEYRREEALAYLERAIRLAPDHPELYFDAAATSALMGNDAAALDYLEQAEAISTPVKVYKVLKQKAFKNLRTHDPGKAYEAALIPRARQYERSAIDHVEPVPSARESLSLE